jgi:hypothetical protein
MPGRSAPRRVEQSRSRFAQLSGLVPRWQDGRQEVRHARNREAACGQPVVTRDQRGVVVAGGRIDREHAGRIPDPEHTPPGQGAVHVAGERGHRPQRRHVLFTVEHRLVKMRDRPAQRDVHPEQRGQLGRGIRRRRVAPRAEGHQQVARLVEREVAVHHRRDADRADPVEADPVALLDVGDQVGVRRLESRPDVVECVGPRAVYEPVLPRVTADGQDAAGVVGVDQARLDPGRAELDSQRRAAIDDDVAAHLPAPSSRRSSADCP